MAADPFKNLTESVVEEVIGWRRHLHRHPELSYQEVNTSQFVFDTLKSFGLEVSRPAGTSVMARLTGAGPGKVLAMRADMDALPVQEESKVEFASENPGVMHACGHDANTAMLLGAARVLTRLQDRISGEIRFLFQHAEEMFPPGGAEEMVTAGVMDGVDFIIGAHIWVYNETGKIGISYGPTMAAPDTFHLTVRGKGGHAAAPHQTVDPVVTGAQIVTNLQHIVARNVDPLDNVVISVGKFAGGTRDNIIPDTVLMEGTIRTFDPKLRERVPGLMERVIKGICEAHGATYDFRVEQGYRPVVNDEAVTRILEKTVRQVLGDEACEKVPPSMGGEDFSAYLQKAPGSFFFVGAGKGDLAAVYPHHHPRFSIDENSLVYGVKTFVNAAINLLGENG